MRSKASIIICIVLFYVVAFLRLVIFIFVNLLIIDLSFVLALAYLLFIIFFSRI